MIFIHYEENMEINLFNSNDYSSFKINHLLLKVSKQVTRKFLD